MWEKKLMNHYSLLLLVPFTRADFFVGLCLKRSLGQTAKQLSLNRRGSIDKSMHQSMNKSPRGLWCLHMED